MRARRTIALLPDRLTVAAIGLLALVVTWNAFRYPSVAGYDAEIDLEYARILLREWRVPTELANYYTPPLFFLVAGPLVELGGLVGLDDRADLAQLLDGALTVATAVLLAALCAILFPGRPWLRFAAVAFFVSSPIVLKTAAMFHPQPLVAFLATLALVLAARLVRDGRYGAGAAVGLGLVLGAGQLVRSVGLWAFGVVFLVLLVAALARPAERGRALRSLVLVTVTALLVALPWYAYLQSRYSNPVFGRSAPSGAVVVAAGSLPPPLAAAYPSQQLWFFVDPGLPALVTAPHREGLRPAFWPILFTETWGDYFGAWAWGSVQRPLTPSVERRLTVQSIAGLLPSFLVLSGLLALFATALAAVRARPELLLVPAMGLAALAGTFYYARSYGSFDGDTVKALFLLPALPAFAACFGFALDVIRARSCRVALVLTAPLALAAGASVLFGIAR